MIVRGPILAVLCAAAPVSAGSVAVFETVNYRGSDAAEPAAATDANTYRNPVLSGFHPDPSIVRVGTDYYLVNSSFGYFPGLPVFHSRDLVNWRQIGNAVDRATMFDLRGLGIARGLFAPTLRYHAGTFYIVNTCVDCGGNFIISAKNPAGPWSHPHSLPDVDGIDPDLFFDDDGRAWIANNGPPIDAPRYDGHRAIWIQELDLRTMATVGSRTVMVDGGVRMADKPIWVEGPHIFKRDGWYYLIAAEGGTAGNHSETVYRSRAVTGPYVPGPVNPILTQRDLDPDRPFPVQATGHADFVQTPGGDWWAVFLGTRPYAANLSNMGRETFLLPVTWPEGGWPLILPPKTPLPASVPRPRLPVAPAVYSSRWSDDFSREALAPEWLMLRTPRVRWAFSGGRNLRIVPRSDSLGGTGNPSFLARRQTNGRAVFETRLRLSDLGAHDRAGIAVFADERHFYFCGVASVDGVRSLVVARRNGADDPGDGAILARTLLHGSAPLRLRVRIDGGRIGFDTASGRAPYAAVVDGADGRMLASEPTNQFTGTVLGLFAQRGR